MARQTCLCVTAGPHGAPRGQGKHGSETKQVWGLQPKGGKFSTESVQNQQMGCASRWRRAREFRGVTQVVKLRSRAQNNTNQSATDVNSSAQTTTKEQTTLVARISLQENILTQVTLTPGFLLPKTCSYSSLYPEDITGPQGRVPISSHKRLPSKRLCSQSPRGSREREPRRGWRVDFI